MSVSSIPNEGDMVEVIVENQGVVARGRVSDRDSQEDTVGENNDSELYIEKFTVTGDSRTVRVSVSRTSYEDEFLEGSDSVSVKVLEGDDVSEFGSVSWREV